jgi:single-strand DNA-binding protein
MAGNFPASTRPHAKERAMNVVILRGSLTRPPEERALPSGDRVVSYDVRTEQADGPGETVPVVGAPPETAFEAGDAVVVTGRVRRRFYRTGGATQSRTEVVADVVVPASDGRRVRRAVDAALRLITASGGREQAAPKRRTVR